MRVRPAALSALVFAGAVAVPAAHAASESAMEPARSLPDSLVLETMDGEAFDLGSLRGERTLIVTWASW